MIVVKIVINVIVIIVVVADGGKMCEWWRVVQIDCQIVIVLGGHQIHHRWFIIQLINGSSNVVFTIIVVNVVVVIGVGVRGNKIYFISISHHH